MIRLNISEKYIVQTLEKCGYVPHHKGQHHGYIKKIGPSQRWHAYWRETNLEIHLDITIEGKHRVAWKFKQLEKEHKEELMKAKEIVRREWIKKLNPLGAKKLARLKYKVILPREKLLEALKQIKTKSSLPPIEKHN